MAKIRVLNKEDIKAVFTLADALEAVERKCSITTRLVTHPYP